MRAVAIAVALLFASAHAGACPLGQMIEVDNDAASSGYSEEKPENWVSHNVEACKGNYRYLSQYVGDGTRKGKAIWQPKIAVAGMYRVTTGFRASVNRTDDADYALHADVGGVKKQSVNQQTGSGCQKVVIGDAYCAVGGSCRLVLDGDDGKSDAADVTTFELVGCDAADAGGPGACAGIAAVPAYEVCVETSTTCAGTYSDGSGCTAYCAAAGMQCVARFGGEPGCSKEPQNPIACAESNGNASDYCECALPPGAGGAGGSAGAPAGGGGSAGSGGGTAGSGGWTGSGATLGAVDAGAASGGGSKATDSAEDGGCGCRLDAKTSLPNALFALVGFAVVLVISRRAGGRRARSSGR